MIFIKDSIPKSCYDCKFSYADTCPVLKKPVSFNSVDGTKHKDCPLIEIRCDKCKYYRERKDKIDGTGTCGHFYSSVVWNGFCNHYVKRPDTFIDDQEKMRDFWELSKEEFLQSYSYLTEKEYDATVEELKQKLNERSE